MYLQLIISLAENAALLLGLSVIYQYAYSVFRYRKYWSSLIMGLLIGSIGLFVMTSGFDLHPGLNFDTRSVLLGVTAYQFGPLPTAIAVIMMLTYRILQGGVGTLTGCAVIISIACLGLLARRFDHFRSLWSSFAHSYIFGIVLHIDMLLCMFFLPYPLSVDTLYVITLPVLAIYPVATALLNELLNRQKDRIQQRGDSVASLFKYRSIFENNHAAMLLMEPETGRILEANPAAVEFYGWPHEKLLQMRIEEINTLPLATILDEMQQSVHEGRHYFQFKHRVASGEIRDVEVFGGPIKIHSRTVLMSIVHDVSQRIAAEKAKEDSEERFRLLVSEMEQGSALHEIILDDQGTPVDYRFIDINEAFTTMTGLTKEQVTGKTIKEILPGVEPVWIERYGRVALSGISDHFEDYSAALGRYYEVHAYQPKPLQFAVIINDITERHAMEKALKESMEFFRAAFEQGNIGAALIDLNGKFIKTNEYFASSLGYSVDELLAMNMYDLSHPDDLDHVRILMADLQESRLDSAIYEKQCIHQTGRQITCLCSMGLMRDDNKKPLYYVNYMLDITAHKEMELALQNRDEKLSRQNMLLTTLLAVLPIGIIMLDVNSHEVIMANEASNQLLGRSEYPTTSVQELRDLFQIKRISTGLPYPLDEMPIARGMRGEASHIDDVVVFRPDGSKVLLEVFGTPVLDQSGQIWASLVAFLDITQRRNEHDMLVTSEAQYRTLVEKAPLGVIIHVDDLIRYINPSALSMLGYEDEQSLLHQDVLSIVHEDYRQVVFGRIHELRDLGNTLDDVEEQFIRSDGSIVDVEVRTIASFFGQDQGIMVFFKDITDRKRREREKLDSDARMQQQQKLEAIGTLASGVAHEINNPINGIMNYAELMIDEVDPNSEQRKYLASILSEGNRIADIVRSLLQFSRQETHSHSYAKIEDIVDRTVILIRNLFMKDSIDLRISLDADLPEIKCRSQQIQQVLLNLLTNARDALNERYPGSDPDKVIEISCQAFTNEGRNWVRFSVNDHGTGIPYHLRDRIFDPFFSTKPKDKGTGLGLAISYGIVVEHHGRIELESEPGSGTTFHVILPVDNEWENSQRVLEDE